MNSIQQGISVVIICALPAIAVADSVAADGQPSLELLQLLGEWQPEDERWLEQLDNLDRLVASSEPEEAVLPDQQADYSVTEGSQ
jgi:hypothetical protein